MFTKTYKHEISLQQWVGVPITSELSLRFLKISLFTLDMSGVWSLDTGTPWPASVATPLSAALLGVGLVRLDIKRAVFESAI